MDRCADRVGGWMAVATLLLFASGCSSAGDAPSLAPAERRAALEGANTCAQGWMTEYPSSLGRQAELSDSVSGGSSVILSDATAYGARSIRMTGQTYRYSIPVAKSGSYRVFVRGKGATTGSNSVDVVAQGGSATAVHFNTLDVWTWSGGPSFTLSNARPHQPVAIEVRTREQQTEVDAIALVLTSSTEVPDASFVRLEKSGSLAFHATAFDHVTDPDGDGLTWTVTPQPLAFGGTTLKAGDFSGTDTDDSDVVYRVRFDTAGSYWVYFHARGFSGSTNSLDYSSTLGGPADADVHFSDDGTLKWKRAGTQVTVTPEQAGKVLGFRLGTREGRTELDSIRFSTTNLATVALDYGAFVHEAEGLVLGGTVAADSGASGGSRVGNLKNAGDGTDLGWVVGGSRLSIRYSLSASTAKQISVLLDEKDVGTAIFAPTGAWTSYAETSFFVPHTGMVILRLDAEDVAANESQATAAIDRLSASPAVTPNDPKLWQDYVSAQADGRAAELPDFSHAGYKYLTAPITTPARIFDVEDFGAIGGDALADDAAIEAAIEAATSAGGGVVFFPPGRFIVTDTTQLDDVIHVTASNIVLRGSGSGNNGSEIFLSKMRVKSGGAFAIHFHPAGGDIAQLVGNLVADARRETYSIVIDQSGNMPIGEGSEVAIRYRNGAYSSTYFAAQPLLPDWTEVADEFRVYESHRVARIDTLPNARLRVSFSEPIHGDFLLHEVPFELVVQPRLENVGVEDLRFTGNWASYPDEFCHHGGASCCTDIPGGPRCGTDQKEWEYDYAYSALRFESVANSFIRRCVFADLNQGVRIDSSRAVTIEKLRFTGKAGHHSIQLRNGSYGLLARDIVDDARNFHGPSSAYWTTNNVIQRVTQQRDMPFDFHSGLPYANLIDDSRGTFHYSGGPGESMPNHAKHLVFWNLAHDSSVNRSYDFWKQSSSNRHNFLDPFFVGLQPLNGKTITFVDAATKVGFDEARGRRVSPTSLFDAQVALTRCGTPPP